MELMADSAQRACVYLDGASENMWLCVWAFPSLLHVLCLTPGFCASCVFVDEPVSRGRADWRSDWAIILSKREKLIIWLQGLGVTSGPSASHWSTESRALGRSMCVCVCLRSCAHLHFLWMCVWRFFHQAEEARVGCVRRCSVDTLLSHLLYKLFSDDNSYSVILQQHIFFQRHILMYQRGWLICVNVYFHVAGVWAGDKADISSP